MRPIKKTRKIKTMVDIFSCQKKILIGIIPVFCKTIIANKIIITIREIIFVFIYPAFELFDSNHASKKQFTKYQLS